MFLTQIRKKYQTFSAEKFHILEMLKSLYITWACFRNVTGKRSKSEVRIYKLIQTEQTVSCLGKFFPKGGRTVARTTFICEYAHRMCM